MAIISLVCEQCGGSIKLDDSQKFGICEYCFTRFAIEKKEIVNNITKNITQNITKYVYGYKGKDVEELLLDAYKLLDLGDDRKANAKFRQALDVEPDCWSAWLGYASTGGDRTGYLSIVPAYEKAYYAANGEKQQLDTFNDMVRYLPDRHLRSAFIRAFNLAPAKNRDCIFDYVSGVIGCDESEIASLALDLCPNDWRAHFAMAKFRQIRARWCELEGGFFSKKHLPADAMEVSDIFIHAYRLAKSENTAAGNTVLSYIDAMGNDSSYRVFAHEVKAKIKKIC